MTNLSPIAVGRIPLEPVDIDELDQGKNEVYQGMIAVGNERYQSFIKVLPTKQLVNELVAYVVGRALGFPIPTGFLVRASASDIPDSQLLTELIEQSGEEEVFVFGSQDAQLPSLARYARDIYVNNTEFDEVDETLSSTRSDDDMTYFEDKDNFLLWKELIIFDAWIANTDRHPGNLLVAEGGNAFWIDHTHCLTGEDWDCDKWQDDAICKNIVLTTWRQRCLPEEKMSLASRTDELIAQINELDLDQLSESAHLLNFLTGADAKKIQRFLEGRAQHLQSLGAQQITPRSTQPRREVS